MIKKRQSVVEVEVIVCRFCLPFYLVLFFFVKYPFKS